ncbi:MAG: 50S ribosomal protein L18e [Candidatus Brockarchaeota archaeon]|nr:50S ribosomal protein L18e [Candidatus Brockarchaeota archaeon]
MAGKRRVNQALYETSVKLRIAGKRGGSRIWPRLAGMLLLPKRRRVRVNVLKINRETSPGESVAVAGKVLGFGDLDHAVTVSAYSFSPAARKKILEAGGRCMSLEEMAEENPRGSNVKIIR